MSQQVIEGQMQELQGQLEQVEAELGKLRPHMAMLEQGRERLTGAVMALQETLKLLQAPAPAPVNGVAPYEPVAS